MSNEFDSAWLKWGRAVVHAQALEAQIVREMDNFNIGQPYSARTEYDPKRHCVLLKLDTIDPLPPLLGLLLGDAANNFRSCLDHLAWALVTTRPKRAMKAKERERVYFPLTRTQDAFDSHLVPGQLLNDRDRKIIRRYQPFWHTARRRPHPKRKIHLHCFAVLTDLNKDDKHRILRPVARWPTSGKLFVGAPRDCTITKIPQRARGIILEPGAEIQRVYVRRCGSNPDVYIEAALSVEPTFDGKVTLLNWLAQTTFHSRDLLLRFAQPPNEILTLGIVPQAT